MTTSARRLRCERLFLAGAWAGMAGIFILLTAAGWPRWWHHIIPEYAALAWFESLLLAVTALLAFAGAGLAYINRDGSVLRWGLLGAAFLCLTIDERFAIHERLRDAVLAPRGIRLPIFFWTADGDFILLLLLIAGLAALPWFLALFRTRRAARRFFLAGLTLAAAAVLMDSLDFHAMSVDLLRREQYLEELFETAGMLCFLSAVFLQAGTGLQHILGERSQSS